MSSRYDGLQKIIDEALRSMAAEIEKGSTAFTTVHALRDEDRTIVGYRELDFWNQESMGTQKFFEVAVPIIDALENGKAIFIDEYGSFIHPTLSGPSSRFSRARRTTQWGVHDAHHPRHDAAQRP